MPMVLLKVSGRSESCCCFQLYSWISESGTSRVVSSSLSSSEVVGCVSQFWKLGVLSDASFDDEVALDCCAADSTDTTGAKPSFATR
jgi:hypothetical protein